MTGDGESLADQDLVEDLAVALEDVRVALLHRQGARQVDQSCGTGADHDVDGPAELEVVDVPEHHHVCALVSSEYLVDERPDLLRLEVTLGLRGAHRLLPPAKQRVVATLGGEVVGDRENRLASEGELGDEGLAGALPGGAGRGDPSRVEGEVRFAVNDREAFGRGCVARGSSREPDPPVSAVQEDLADVAAGLPAIGEVLRVDPARTVGGATGRHDRGDQLVRGTG